MKPLKKILSYSTCFSFYPSRRNNLRSDLMFIRDSTYIVTGDSLRQVTRRYITNMDPIV